MDGVTPAPTAPKELRSTKLNMKGKAFFIGLASVRIRVPSFTSDGPNHEPEMRSKLPASAPDTCRKHLPEIAQLSEASLELVCDPFNPVMVTIDPTGSCLSGCRVIVMVVSTLALGGTLLSTA